MTSKPFTQSIEENYVRASRKGSSSQGHSFDSELARRRMGLFFYLIRSPLFDRCVSGRLFTLCVSLF